jgi:hypothetical protein
VTELSANQQKAALAIAQGRKVADAAKLVKVRRETVSEWKRVPEFADLVTQLRRELWEAAIARAVGMVDTALDAAEAIAKGEKGAKPAEQLAAARLILDTAARVDAAELADRVAALEAQAEAEG